MFAERGLTFLPEGGAPLPVEIRLAEPRERVDRQSPFAGQIDPYSGRRLPKPPEDPRVLFVELFYAFPDGERPQELTFKPPRNEAGNDTATIGMLVFHRDVPVIDFRFLSGGAKISLDWEDPWFSAFDNPNLKRHHRYPQMSFLYAEPFEIRHEALIRIRDALALTGFDATGATLSKEEADALIEAAADQLAKRSPMTVDGAPVTPDFDRGAMLKIGERGLVFLGPDEPVSVDAAILGLIWSVPVDGYPQVATVEWTLFDDARAPVVQGYAIDAAGPFLSPMTKDDPILTWTNHFTSSAIPVVEEIEGGEWAELNLPALSIGMGALALVLLFGALRGGGGRRRASLAIGCAAMAAGAYVALPYGQVGIARPSVAPVAMSEEQAKALTEQLLANVYRSFEFKGEDQVYDRLAKTLDGGVLEQVYLDQRRSLRIARAGGAEARVQEVLVDAASPTPLGGASDFVIRTKWKIIGRVGHWGHQHTRVNVYEADLSVSAEGGAWKIIGFEVLSQDRLS